MGQNQYVSWDDKKMAAVERRYERRLRALTDRMAARHNKLIQAIELLHLEERRQIDLLKEKWREESEAICVKRSSEDR